MRTANSAAFGLQMRMRRARILRDYRRKGGDSIKDLDKFRRASKGKRDTVFSQAKLEIKCE